MKFLRVLIISFASLAEKKLISFPFKLPDGKFITWFDPDKFEKIINNLLSNAFKFTPEGGEVKCKVKLPGQEKELMEVIVSDTGIGIPSNEINNVFDRFHQVKSSSYNGSGGVGIGLALTKELVELLHGEIDVRSKLGFYLYSPFEPLDAVYQRYGILFKISDRVFTGINMKAHRHVADFLDLRTGITF
ncbi:unnamed protein product [marine sediment metagenome]|uniref:Histidine kinase domain-containing protein n=1 Tax=marine sediment metagenome TaxID=412755 RepID=X0Z494_9ZZZZ